MLQKNGSIIFVSQYLIKKQIMYAMVNFLNLNDKKQLNVIIVKRFAVSAK